MSEEQNDGESQEEPRDSEVVSTDEAIAGAPEEDAPITLREALWYLARLLPFAIIVALALVPVAYHATSTPAFCKSCHIMVPYWDSWNRSPHADVDCLACHIEPGLKGKLKGKFTALNQLVSYVTQTHGTRPWADVSDENCLACHKETELDLKAAERSIKFRHDIHTRVSIRDKHLKCTTCHAQLDTRDHMTIARQACYLCHFKPMADGSPPRGARCTECHDVPDKEIEYQDTRTSHKDIVARGVSCQHCHSSVVEGTGPVSKNRCWSCHADPKAIEHYSNPIEVHEKHVSVRGVDCLNCHNEITHQKRPVDVNVSRTKCAGCHSSMHQGPAALYAGTLLGSDAPSPMYRSGIDCQACHTAAIGGRPDKTACRRCHEEGIEPMFTAWMAQITQGIEAVETNARSLSVELPPTAAASSSATVTWALQVAGALRQGRGIHNVQLSRKLLSDADDAIRGVVTSNGLATGMTDLDLRTFQDKGDDECVRCHFGIEQVEVPYEGKTFSHQIHAIDNDARCLECHKSNNGHHGVLIVDKEEYCAMCH